MKIKICGLKFPSNIDTIITLKIDMIGFIFYKKSSRYVGDNYDETYLKRIPTSIQKVGVFVDEKESIVLQTIKKYDLNIVQLHGNESASYCENLKANNIQIIKAFQIDDDFDFEHINSYHKVCDYFLFDTKGKEKGGNGLTFNWDLLHKYKINVPFFLSGGLGIENIDEALAFSHPQLIGFDINSKIEIEPASKSFELAEIITTKIHKYDSYKTR